MKSRKTWEQEVVLGCDSRLFMDCYVGRSVTLSYSSILHASVNPAPSLNQCVHKTLFYYLFSCLFIILQTMWFPV